MYFGHAVQQQAWRRCALQRLMRPASCVALARSVVSTTATTAQVAGERQDLVSAVERNSARPSKDVFDMVKPVLAPDSAETDGRDDVSPNTAPTAAVESGDEIDVVRSARNRRRNKQKRTMDTLLRDLLHDAIRQRDAGGNPTADFVYERAQERLRAQETGRHTNRARRRETGTRAPYPPDLSLHRLLALHADAAATGTEGNQAGKNELRTYYLLEDDPWPARAITTRNPVWTRRQVEEDKAHNGGAMLRACEERMYGLRDDCDRAADFLDALDELAYWEERVVIFIRAVPLSQRRALPYLHEWQRYLYHRAMRAVRRYEVTRAPLLTRTKASPALYARSEERVERLQDLFDDIHRSLSSANHDPLRMKRSSVADFLRMSDDDFQAWRQEQRRERNALFADLS